MKHILRTLVAKIFLFLVCCLSAVYGGIMIIMYYTGDNFYDLLGAYNFNAVAVSLSISIVTFTALLVVTALTPKSDEPRPYFTNYIPTDVMIILDALLIGGGGEIIFEELYRQYDIIYGRYYHPAVRVNPMCYVGLAYFIFAGLVIIVDIVGRIKTKFFFKNTVIAWCIKLIGKFFKLLIKFVKALPYIWRVVTLTAILEFINLIVILCCWYEMDNYMLWWVAMNIVLLPIVFYGAWNFHQLKTAAKRMSEGDFEQGIDTRKMIWGFKEQGQSLNQLMTGMNVAVAEKTKSERMKTELITNVSHDLKTPLTSIINYADLIKTENEKEIPSRETIAEYSEVLYRQSGKLKRLLEDLLEVSKANSGAVEVNLEECDVDILLGQAVGEFEDRLAQCELSPIITLPEEPVKIMADRLHLWRVFDNLLNNICKYSLPGSRVFFTVTKERISHPGFSEGQDNEPYGTDYAVISFKNTSKDLLNVSPDELKERFVRGDKSRTSENSGHGLGLAIATSLTELQNGTLELSADADLFTAVLKFKIVD